MTAGLWAHKNALDLRFLIVKVSYRGPEYIKVKMHYIDHNNNALFHLPETIIIYRKDFGNWTKLTNY